MTRYVSFNEISDTQLDIMRIITKWSKKNKTPILRKVIIFFMKQQHNKKESTVILALHGLIVKGYIRYAYENKNKTAYVQIRSI